MIFWLYRRLLWVNQKKENEGTIDVLAYAFCHIYIICLQTGWPSKPFLWCTIQYQINEKYILPLYLVMGKYSMYRLQVLETQASKNPAVIAGVAVVLKLTLYQLGVANPTRARTNATMSINSTNHLFSSRAMFSLGRVTCGYVC